MELSTRRTDTRRRPRRAEPGLSLTCTRILETHHGGPSNNLAVELRDISWGGVQFVSTEPLARPCTLNLLILHVSTGEVLSARGDVVWGETRQKDGRNTHLVGVQFDEIFTPLARCEKFFKFTETPAPGPSSTAFLSRSRMRRRRERFKVMDYEVTLRRPRKFWFFGGSKNLAMSLVDLSESGAQVACTEEIAPGTGILLTLHLKKFADKFGAGAKVVWCRRAASKSGGDWAVGLHFEELEAAAQKLLSHMMSWFTSERARFRRQG